MTDPYEVLQVHQLAEPEVIQAAFRVLARKHHPDAGGDPARMVALNGAWRIIGNEKRRATFDRKRAGSAPTPPPTTTPTPTPAPEPVVRSAAGPIFDPYMTRSAPSEPGSVLDFGRYAGWSISRLAAEDPTYLEWLARASIGRRFAREIYVALARRPAVATMPPPTPRARWGRR